MVFNGWGQWFDTDIYGSTTYELGADYECVGRFAMSPDDELKYDNNFIKLEDLTRLYRCANPKCHFKELITIFHNGECSEYAAFNSESEYSIPITHAEFPTFLINRDKKFQINRQQDIFCIKGSKMMFFNWGLEEPDQIGQCSEC